MRAMRNFLKNWKGKIHGKLNVDGSITLKWMWYNLISSKGTVKVYRSTFCSNIFSVSTVSSIQPRISFEGTWWYRVSLPYAEQRKTADWTLCPLWEEIISSNIRGFKSPSNNSKQWSLNSLSEVYCLLKIIHHLWQQQSRRDALPQWKE
jgi:hypothetical protein